MVRVVFSTDDLPPGLDDRARFSRWVEAYCSVYGNADVSRLADRPFSARTEYSQIGGIGLVEFEGAVNRVALDARHLAAHRSVEPMIGLVIPRNRMAIFQHGREQELNPGDIGIVTNTEPCDVRAEPAPRSLNAWLGVAVSVARLSELVTDVENRIAVPLDPNSPAVRHLCRYLDIVAQVGRLESDPVLAHHIDTTLTDLIAIALGAGRDALEMAHMGGQRAARAREIVAIIAARFTDTAFSPQDVCLKLGLSQRYIQDLLHETGLTFTERALELRLQKARTKLADRRNDHLKVGEIAFACGFGDISYFNQAFRRRFGAAPTHFRGMR